MLNGNLPGKLPFNIFFCVKTRRKQLLYMYPDTKALGCDVMNRDERERRFVQAVRERRSGMYRVALSMLRSQQDAEDAASAAMEAAWKQLDRIADMDALPAYLMRCTVNACRRVLRHKRRVTPIEDMAPLMPKSVDPIGVWEYLDSLPEKYRLPLILRYAEDMGVSEVARALRMTRSGASSRIQRGLRILKKQLNEEVSGRE